MAFAASSRACRGAASSSDNIDTLTWEFMENIYYEKNIFKKEPDDQKCISDNASELEMNL